MQLRPNALRITLLTRLECVCVIEGLNIVIVLGILCVADFDPMPFFLTVPVKDPAHFDRELADLAIGALKGGVVDVLGGYVNSRKTSCK